MDQLRNYGDDRQLAWCVYCAGRTETRDHVPPKVLLDQPYPSNLPVVPACRSCNVGLSLHEEYLACLIDCALTGSVDACAAHRTKIKKILEEKPALVGLLRQARLESAEGVVFVPDKRRTECVVLKLARGHAAYELNEPQFDEPSGVSFMPVHSMVRSVRDAFENPPETSVCPEVGSRAMQRLFVATSSPWSGWITAQPGRYRYMTTIGDGLIVRIVLSEYLGCEVIWS